MAIHTRYLVCWVFFQTRDKCHRIRFDLWNLDKNQSDNLRKHLSFGFGIHRCMGNRLAELQLRVLWQEILNRFERIEVAGEPVRTVSSFVHGYTSLPVRIHPREG